MSFDFVPVSPVSTPQWDASRSELLADPSQAAFRIETTNHCNFRCTFCGEPLLDKHLVERVAFARAHGFTYILIITNGLGWNARRLDALAEAGMPQIVLSLSPRREFIETRPGTNVEKLWRDIASLTESPHKAIAGVDYIRTGSSTAAEEAELKEFLDGIGIRLRMEVALHNWAEGPAAGLSRHLCHRLCKCGGCDMVQTKDLR